MSLTKPIMDHSEQLYKQYKDEVQESINKIRAKYLDEISNVKFESYLNYYDTFTQYNKNYHKVSVFVDTSLLDNDDTVIQKFENYLSSYLNTYLSPVFLFDSRSIQFLENSVYFGGSTEHDFQNIKKTVHKLTKRLTKINEYNEILNISFDFNYIVFFQDKNEAAYFKLIADQLIGNFLKETASVK